MAPESQSNPSSIANLSNDLTLNIFYRLPIKAVVISKSVCRAWHELLSDPEFSSHYNRNSPFYTLVLTQGYVPRSRFSFLEFSPNGECIKTPFYFPPRVPGLVRDHYSTLEIIKGSCNGFLFLLHREVYDDHSMNDKVYLCNPLSRGCVQLTGDETKHSRVNYKLGYIQSAKTFKLMRVVSRADGFMESAGIMTVGVDHNWRALAVLISWRDGLSFNGCYHWVPHQARLGWLPTFDFDQERSWKIPKPSGLSRIIWDQMKLAVLNNHLSLFHFDRSCVVWTMKEYGVAESWSRDIVLRDRFPYRSLTGLDVVAITGFPNGDILFSERNGSGGRLVRWSFEKQQSSEIRITDISMFAMTYADTFVPRLSSLREDYPMH